MAWMPSGKGSDNAFALGCADGTFRLISEMGREEKKVDAHRGAVIALRSHAIYSVVWSPDCEHILFACSSKIHLKSIQAGQKQVEWKAHEGVVMMLDWSFVNNTILSAGEDCRYKIWDAYGRLLFNSAPLDHVVTSIAWSPTGW
eukprot:g20849.t1